MKKTFKLPAILLLTLPALMACPAQEEGYVEKRTEQEVVEALARQAIDEVGVGYAKFSSDGLRLGDNALVTTVNEKVYEGDTKGLNFSVAYTLTADENYGHDYVTLDTTANKLVAELVTEADLNTDIARALGGFAYTLHATLTFEGFAEGFEVKGLTPTGTVTFTLNEEWSVIDKACISGTIEEVKAVAKNNAAVSFKGQVAGWISNSYDDMYTGVFLTDGANGMMLYAGNISKVFFNENKELIINEGAYLDVFGYVSIYNGLFEVKPSKITVLTDPADYAGIAPAVVTTYNADQVAAIKTASTGNLIKVEHLKLKDGFDIDKKMKDGAHWTIECVDQDGKQVNLYANYHMGTEAQAAIKTLLKGLTAGQRFTVYGATSMSGTTKPTVQLMGNSTRSTAQSIQIEQ